MNSSGELLTQVESCSSTGETETGAKWGGAWSGGSIGPLQGGTGGTDATAWSLLSVVPFQGGTYLLGQYDNARSMGYY